MYLKKGNHYSDNEILESHDNRCKRPAMMASLDDLEVLSTPEGVSRRTRRLAIYTHDNTDTRRKLAAACGFPVTWGFAVSFLPKR